MRDRNIMTFGYFWTKKKKFACIHPLCVWWMNFWIGKIIWPEFCFFIFAEREWPESFFFVEIFCFVSNFSHVKKWWWWFESNLVNIQDEWMRMKIQRLVWSAGRLYDEFFFVYRCKFTNQYKNIQFISLFDFIFAFLFYF